ncbi:MAG: AAA family ATPase, partial [Lachnospiraceae bacterium]|nr:AAA family ATPase [Lachnospiraceae bacterium]
TLNLSTVECFFSNKYKSRSDLFEGRLVWKDEDLRKLQGTYPVIFMSFAGVKSGYGESEAGEKLLDNVETMKTAVKQIISDIYAKFRDIMKSESFDENDRAYFASVNDNMTDRTAHVAIRRLCGYLEKVYGKKVIILLDEYDTPMQESWVYGYWNHAVAFLRRFVGIG